MGRVANITAERAKELLDYNPHTGVFTWKVTSGPRIAGTTAGGLHKGAFIISLDRTACHASRLAWLIMTGEHCPKMVGFKNKNNLDLRWENLIEITRSQCLIARKVWGKASKYKGVSRDPSRPTRWRAQVGHNYTHYHLGFFETEEEAARVYDAKAFELHGEFARLNFPDEYPKAA